MRCKSHSLAPYKNDVFFGPLLNRFVIPPVVFLSCHIAYLGFVGQELVNVADSEVLKGLLGLYG